jgi:hypothetical protein
VWPLSASAEDDADVIRYPYGPRWIGRYDFHGGIDLPADDGTPVHAIAAGTVAAVEPWDGASSAGNKVLVAHADEKWSAYLHLSAIDVGVGDAVLPGTQVGESGSTGATWDHLHLTTMVGLTSPKVSESKSVNPLRWLPHADPAVPDALFGDVGVVIALESQRMTVQTVTLEGASESVSVDYADVVALGSTARDEPVQGGIRFAAGSPDAGLFELTLAADTGFALTSVVLEDFDGGLVLEASP